MALDTYTSIAGKVLLRCPMAGPLLARDWVTNAFRQVAERRPWSWLVKQGQFVLPALYNTGTATLVQNSATVTGIATAWTTALIGRQFRLTTTTPIYTITAVDAGLQTLTLDLPWGAVAERCGDTEVWLDVAEAHRLERLFKGVVLDDPIDIDWYAVESRAYCSTAGDRAVSAVGVAIPGCRAVVIEGFR